VEGNKMAKKPTMRVIRGNVEVVINISDFDPKIHKKMGEVKVKPEVKPEDDFESKNKTRKKREKNKREE
jgi:hypothetical protein